MAAWMLKNPYPWILVARVVQGIGGGGTYQLAMALAGDIYTGKERSRALGYLEAANGLGKVVAPLLGSATALLVWFAPFSLWFARLASCIVGLVNLQRATTFSSARSQNVCN